MQDFEIDATYKSEASAEIRDRVETARSMQRERFSKSPYFCNAHMSNKDIRDYCQLSQEGKDLIRQAVQRYSLSARAYTRVLKVARTIADLAGDEGIKTPYLAEAIQYRSLDQKANL